MHRVARAACAPWARPGALFFLSTCENRDLEFCCHGKLVTNARAGSLCCCHGKILTCYIDRRIDRLIRYVCLFWWRNFLIFNYLAACVFNCSIGSFLRSFRFDRSIDPINPGIRRSNDNPERGSSSCMTVVDCPSGTSNCFGVEKGGLVRQSVKGCAVK